MTGDLIDAAADFAGDVPLAVGRYSTGQIIQIGDELWGQGLVNTPPEDDLLTHWLGGSGDTVVLQGADRAAVRNHPANGSACTTRTTSPTTTRWSTRRTPPVAPLAPATSSSAPA